MSVLVITPICLDGPVTTESFYRQMAGAGNNYKACNPSDAHRPWGNVSWAPLAVAS
jgi:hypothetical protein